MNITEIIFESSIYTRWTNSFEYLENGQKRYSTIDYEVSQYTERIELYCIKCESKRIFVADKAVYKDAMDVINGTHGSLKNKPSLYKTFRCSAHPEHIHFYGFLVEGEELVKIAEYPSKYDSVIEKFNKYKKILSSEKLSELAKASQLESFGFAIASFLYYRRIFESIILETYKSANIQDKITEEEFRSKRMDDKTEYIKESLPEYFTQNSHIYSTLSKGVHELEEKECREYLPIVREIILYSLDEAVDKRNHELRKIEFAKKLKDINSKLK
ncbi:hypothetical protein [uncultured Chryseobacterium sp.]|uniref:hypothetical protein n=1 Tax=uncultured Chryseobacterium sp. TaxID=259322 RepID=UPI0025CC0433|nr:hypothetical protein [uncultured Chryseobacterium sp.]